MSSFEVGCNEWESLAYSFQTGVEMQETSNQTNPFPVRIRSMFFCLERHELQLLTERLCGIADIFTAETSHGDYKDDHKNCLGSRVTACILYPLS